MIENVQAFVDFRIQFIKREKPLITDRGYNPSRGYSYRALDGCLIFLNLN